MSNIKVSIVIPVYNGHPYLEEAIESSLRQTYSNTEIIVVNDGSTDGGKTEKIALLYGNKIRYFYKPNGGVAAALNFAVSKSSGDYISWLSHDDLYNPTKIERQITELLSSGRDNIILYSDYAVFSDNPEKSRPVRMKGVSSENFRYWITVENTLHGCTLLIPKAAFDQYGYFNEQLKTTQDYDLWYRLAKHFDFVHMPEELVRARHHSEQGSRKMANIALSECNDLLSFFIENLSSDEIQSATNRTLADSYRELAFNMYDRGFFIAARLAESLAIQNGSDADFLSCYKTKEKSNVHTTTDSMFFKSAFKSFFNKIHRHKDKPEQNLKKKFYKCTKKIYFEEKNHAQAKVLI